MARDLNAEQEWEDSKAKADHANLPERLVWFRRQGVGAFIHFSVDVQLGTVISHNLINANEDYRQRYFNDLPQTFCPERFDARAWASFLRVIGMRYVILTNKHHNGFCMWHTDTTDWSIANTPFARDMTRELFDACRAEGLGIGVYFSPDDFHKLHQQGITISRRNPGVLPKDNPELMALAKAQVTELLTNYGPIDMIFYDGDATGLRELTWELQPDCVVTRGALRTPEQRLPEVDGEQDPASMEPWEACFTLGRQWQYRALHEAYKSPCTLIEMLIKTRAGGGNLLLNFGPKADGSLAPEQEGPMREVGLWLFVNREAIIDVGPYRIAREDKVFYTHSAERDTVYAHLTGIDWPSLPYWGLEDGATVDRDAHIDADGLHTAKARKLVWRLKHVRADADTRISLMAQSANSVMPDAINESVTWEQTADELIITAWYCHRQYNDWYWDLPMVLRIKHPAT